MLTVSTNMQTLDMATAGRPETQWVGDLDVMVPAGEASRFLILEFQSM